MDGMGHVVEFVRCFANLSAGSRKFNGLAGHFVDEGRPAFFPSKALGVARYLLEHVRLNPLEIVEDSIIKNTLITMTWGIFT